MADFLRLPLSPYISFHVDSSAASGESAATDAPTSCTASRKSLAAGEGG